MTTHTTSLSGSTPRGRLLSVIVSGSVALAACGGPTAEVGDAAHDPMQDAQVKADEARARLMASEGGEMLLDVIEKHGGLEAWYAAPTSSYSWEYSNLGSQPRFKTSLVADNTTRRIYHRIMTLGLRGAVEEIDGRMAWTVRTPGSVQPASRRSIRGSGQRTGYYFESIPVHPGRPGCQLQSVPARGTRRHQL